MMLRTQKIRPFSANGDSARRSATPRSTTAVHGLSPIQRRQLVSRQLQLPTGTPLRTTVAKNASRDTTRHTTPRPTPPLATLRRASSPPIHSVAILSRQNTFPRNAQLSSRQRLPTPSQHSVAKNVFRDRSPQATTFASRPHSSSARTASSISAVRGIPCCARACSVTCTAFSVGSSGACSIRACTCVISAPNSKMRHE